MSTDPLSDPILFLNELTRLATNASSLNSSIPTTADISRWVNLFNYTPSEANALIITHRSDITRTPISDEHWSLVRADREKAGFDREAYEHSLLLVDVLRSQSSVVTDGEWKRWTLLRLGGVLGDEKHVREICGVERELKVTKGVKSGIGFNAGDEVVDFVWVDEEGKKKVEEWVRGWGVLGKAKVGEAKPQQFSE
ncbi:hypothetical protein ONS95_006909 [Cadophora gregata]|uniref:uncharacterized protein n=1 Tax=Cadophora gregata TaxID=51156 RepID=UPI0026DC2FFC|nr:uncharacterized protein ONS95_006909 [Cadophora gregata]KAK0101756.1 hypothetical protein ONS95_006909 [Cadophora gregata]KAK0106229.1 hypothetical protein ONS96_003872 [Cadophora gregata f. sp. sojae]